MLPKKEIFNIPIVSADWSEVAEHIAKTISAKRQELIVTANPEIIERSFADLELRDILQKRALVFPDGIGVTAAARILGVELKQRIPGIDLIQLLKPYSLYLIGSKASVIKKAAANLQTLGFNIVGYSQGYFDEIEEATMLQEIKRLLPQIVLVGLGMGKQEKWLDRHLKGLPATIGITVGGSFDILSGEKKRAPLWMRKIGIEWFYRLLQEPKRIYRQLILVKFLFRVLLEWGRRKPLRD